MDDLVKVFMEFYIFESSFVGSFEEGGLRFSIGDYFVWWENEEQAWSWILGVGPQATWCVLEHA